MPMELRKKKISVAIEAALEFKENRTQAVLGGLAEMGLVLAVVAVTLGAGAVGWQSWTDRVQAKEIADKMQVAANAYRSYIADNYSDLVAQVQSGASNVKISINPNDLAAYLPDGDVNQQLKLPDQSEIKFALRYRSNGKLDPLVYLDRSEDSSLSVSSAQKIASSLGAAGAYTDANGNVVSPGGGYELNFDQFVTGSNNNPAVSYALFADGEDGTNAVDGVLYRKKVDGQPGLNRMETDLDMGGKNVGNANNVNSTNLVASEGVQGKNLSATNNITASQTVQGRNVTATQTIQGNALTTPNDGVYITGNAITAKGNISANGTVSGATVTSAGDMVAVQNIIAGNVLRGTQVETAQRSENGSCSPKGAIAHDSSGSILSCQGGKWKKYAGTAPAPDPVPPKNCSGGHKHGSSWSSVISSSGNASCGSRTIQNYTCIDGVIVNGGIRTEQIGPCGSCFPAGMPVLMADGSWKEISTIEAGDMLMGPDGPWVVDSLYITKLGNRRMYRDQDNTILWSEEHLFWSKQDGQQWWWTAGKEAWLDEVERGDTIGLFDNESLLTNKKPTLAHSRDIWREVDMIDVTNQYDYDTPLYMPKSENGESAFISGYLITCGTDQWKKDYTKQVWNNQQSKEVFSDIDVQAIPAIDQVQLNNHWGAACAITIRQKAVLFKEKCSTNMSNITLAA